jgi:hypothetical protein
MEFEMDLSTISKAIAGGVVSALVALGARYGFHASGETVTALGIVVTALVGYGLGHVVVYFAPRNK